MKQYLNTGIKQVIKLYPSLANCLKEYDINCATCNGNCLLKDIFEEHNLSMKEEMELKKKMARIIGDPQSIVTAGG
jgi:predicted metal-binding transcription factor (methanogenesis marker protein 9)